MYALKIGKDYMADLRVLLVSMLAFAAALCPAAADEAVPRAEAEAGVDGGAPSGADQFGAIAWSAGNGVDGYAFSFPTQKAAEVAALNACRARILLADDCRIAAWFYNACAALAASGEGPWGAAYASTRYESERAAMLKCREGGGEDCVIRRGFCSGA